MTAGRITNNVDMKLVVYTPLDQETRPRNCNGC
jgi:hypothetical protein